MFEPVMGPSAAYWPERFPKISTLSEKIGTG